MTAGETEPGRRGSSAQITLRQIHSLPRLHRRPRLEAESRRSTLKVGRVARRKLLKKRQEIQYVNSRDVKVLNSYGTIPANIYKIDKKDAVGIF